MTKCRVSSEAIAETVSPPAVPFAGTCTIPKSLLADPRLSAGQKALLATIAQFASPSKPCDLTHGQLAKRLAVCRTTVARWIQCLAELGYLIVTRFLAPLARAHPRYGYQLPPWGWRMFYASWAVVGPKFRKLASSLLDWLAPRLPLHLLDGVYPQDVDEARSRGRTGSLHKTNITKIPVRVQHPAPDPSEQLNFQQFIQLPSVAPVARWHEAGLRLVRIAGVRPETLARMAGEAQASG